MAKQKKIIEPIKQHGIPLPLEHPEIPNNWLPEDEFSSHRPMLYRAIMNTAHSVFIEFGTGKGSTPLLQQLYDEVFPNKELISYENNFQWYELMKPKKYYTEFEWLESGTFHNHHIVYSDNLLKWNTWKGCIILIDCAPAELRKELISKHSSIAKMIIIHDTEPEAEYIYGLSEILGSFKFRCDLIVKGNPQTTIVSNLYEFENWKTIVNDQIQFI